ncbi:MAG: hypothetical protein ACFFKA_19875 [Candidatus Thorarchaeota archaeon]
MRITFEPDTKKTRIADLKRRKKNSLISESLFKKAMLELEKGKSLIYYVDINGKVEKFILK